MKKTSIIIIPLVVILLLIAGAFVWRTQEMNRRVVSGGLPNSYTAGGSPSQGFDQGLTVRQQQSVQDLTKDLSGTVDDGGADQLQQIKNQANSL